MMEYEEYENPALMDGDNHVGHHEDADMTMMDDEDIPVTQEDAWAVIRYAFTLISLVFVTFQRMVYSN